GCDLGDHRRAQSAAHRGRAAGARPRALPRRGGRTGTALLGREPLEPPALGVTRVAQAVVQAVVAVLPELVALRTRAIAAPVPRPPDVTVGVLALEGGGGLLQPCAVCGSAAP